MTRQPMINRANRGLQRSKTRSLPAPTKGWNTRDPLANMNSGFATTLENFFPRASTVDLRPGAARFGANLPGQPLSLVAWNGPAASKLFAVTNAGFYDVTTGYAGGAVSRALSNGRVETTNFTNAGGNYLVSVNGFDDMEIYNGTGWQTINTTSTPAITGAQTNQLTSVMVIKKRLWFTLKNSSSAYYLPAGQIAGALTEFPLGQIFGRGGYLLAMENWTIDAGDGQDDYAIFVSSQGEIAVYKGTDPASAATFNHVGTYYIGTPLGKKCLTKFGGDLLYLSESGLYPLSKSLQTVNIQRTTSLSDNIAPTFSEVGSLYRQNLGWEVTLYPLENLLLVNIPVTASYTEQYVMNTITGAWCRFIGWFSNCWIVFNSKLYFGSTNFVAQAWVGNSDFGAAILGRAQQAYSYFDYRAQSKHFKLVRPLIATDQEITLAVGMDGDFSEDNYPSGTVVPNRTGYFWDSAIWDTALWSGGAAIRKEWLTIFLQECNAAAFRLQISTSSATLVWTATDFVFELGGVLG